MQGNLLERFARQEMPLKNVLCLGRQFGQRLLEATDLLFGEHLPIGGRGAQPVLQHLTSVGVLAYGALA